MTRGNPDEEEEDSDTDDIDHSGEERKTRSVDCEQTQNAAQFVKP